VTPLGRTLILAATLALGPREGIASGPDCEPPRIRSIGSFGYFASALAVDSQNNLYVSPFSGPAIQKYSPSGVFLGTLGATYRSTGVAVTLSGRVYIVDAGACAVDVLARDGQPEFQWGTCDTNAGDFGNPVGIAVASNGDVYVGDYYIPRIQRFSSTGTYIGEWGSQGSGPGQFAGGVTAFAFSPNGEVLVADAGNCRIERFTPEGVYLGEWALTGNPTFGCNVIEVATDDQGNAYVTDYPTGTVSVFSPTGELRCSWNGSRDQAFYILAGVTVDHLGNIWVADNSGAQEFGYLPVPTHATTWGRLKAAYR